MSDLLTAVAANTELFALVAVTFVAGIAVPFHYGIKRFRSFGRAILSKLPYQPPPGMDVEAAMAGATTEEQQSN